VVLEVLGTWGALCFGLGGESGTRVWGFVGFWDTVCKGLGFKFVLGFAEFCGLAVCCTVFGTLGELGVGRIRWLLQESFGCSQLVGHLSAVVGTVCARKESGEEEE
jgi:hypothetical protein